VKLFSSGNIKSNLMLMRTNSQKEANHGVIWLCLPRINSLNFNNLPIFDGMESLNSLLTNESIQRYCNFKNIMSVKLDIKHERLI